MINILLPIIIGIIFFHQVLTEPTCPDSLLKVASLLKVDKELFMGLYSVIFIESTINP